MEEVKEGEEEGEAGWKIDRESNERVLCCMSSTCTRRT